MDGAPAGMDAFGGLQALGARSGAGAMRLGAAQGPEGALLLEVQCPAGDVGGDAADAPSGVQHYSANRGLGHRPQRERELGGRHVEPPLHREHEPDGVKIVFRELPVRRRRTGGPVAQNRQKTQILTIPEHSGGHAEPSRRL